MGYNGSGGLKQASGDIFVYELLARCPMVKSYHSCFTLSMSKCHILGSCMKSLDEKFKLNYYQYIPRKEKKCRHIWRHK